jgi:hypothetical protein
MNATISSVSPIDASAPIIFSKTNSLEIVSGGSKYETTAISGYKVRHSVGALFSKQIATTPQGYKVYSQIQGRISAEEDKQ